LKQVASPHRWVGLTANIGEVVGVQSLQAVMSAADYVYSLTPLWYDD
jgi:hypothetical protein